MSIAHAVLNRPVMVGVDGSEASQAAAAWAAHEAALRRRPLLVAAVNVWPRVSAFPTTPGWDEKAYRIAEDAVAEVAALAAAAARDAEPKLEISTYVTPGSPVSRILELSERADLVVLGRRGSGGFGNLSLGSTALTVARHAEQSVALIPPNPRPPTDQARDIVVGIDGSERAQAALEFGFAESELRSAPLVPVRVWHHPIYDVPAIDPPFPPLPEDFWSEQQRVLSESLAGWCQKYPDVAVHPKVFYGYTAHCLLNSAKAAEMLVVAPRGGGGFPALRFGSVAETVIQHATVPVVVARQEARNEQPHEGASS